MSGLPFLLNGPCFHCFYCLAWKQTAVTAAVAAAAAAAAAVATASFSHPSFPSFCLLSFPLQFLLKAIADWRYSPRGEIQAETKTLAGLRKSRRRRRKRRRKRCRGCKWNGSVRRSTRKSLFFFILQSGETDLTSRPTFHKIGASNHDVSQLNTTRRYPDLEALKPAKVRSGCDRLKERKAR